MGCSKTANTMGSITIMAYFTVTNINGTADLSPKDGSSSWLEYWENATGREAGHCHRWKCTVPATDGSHVMVQGHGQTWYIVPLCHTDNMSRESFTVSGPLVSATDPKNILW